MHINYDFSQLNKDYYMNMINIKDPLDEIPCTIDQLGFEKLMISYNNNFQAPYRRYLTNFDISQFAVYEEAIEASGCKNIYILKEPMPVTDMCAYKKNIHNFQTCTYIREQMIGKYYSLYIEGDVDTNTFWAVFDLLQKDYEIYTKLRRIAELKSIRDSEDT